MDPTKVHFFTTNVPFDQAKNIQIYGSKVKNSEFVSATIDGRAGTRRVDHYLNNDCTKELTVAEINGIVYGFHIVQCPTHPQGYDQLRKQLAELSVHSAATPQTRANLRSASKRARNNADSSERWQ